MEIKVLIIKSCSVLTTINSQSLDIARGIGTGKKQGAGDQGFVFGYAVDETPECMPLSITLSHKLVRTLAQLRKKGESHIWPDSKSQITVEYENDKIVHIPSIVLSTQHAPDIKSGKI